MLRSVTFRPDPLRDPRSPHESNQWWLALFFAFSGVVHTSLWLALPATERLPPAPAFRATEVFEIDPPPPLPTPPDPPPAPASRPEALSPTQPAPHPHANPDPVSQAQPALAAAVLVANDDAGPLDFTNEFVTGQATTFAGGATSSHGAIRQVRAKSSGAETLRPSAPGNAPSHDQSRRASVVGGFAWSCPFPPAADVAAINFAMVQLRLRVDAHGRLEQLGVMADPGYGFGEAARRCASGKHFLPALARDGAPVGSELVVRVRFTR